MTAPANQQQPFSSSPIAGTVLPIRRAEELLATLPGIIAARIVASDAGAVDEIHVLTTSEVMPKQTVRNVESALIAHLGMKVDHRKISVATSIEPPRAREAREAAREAQVRTPEPAVEPAPAARVEPAASQVSQQAQPAPRSEPRRAGRTEPPPVGNGGRSGEVAVPVPGSETHVSADVDPTSAGWTRTLLFENVDIRRSRTKGVTYRVTLRKGAESFVGESGGLENERSRIEHVARAALEAIKAADGDDRHLMLKGCTVVDAFERQFAFVAVTAREEREAALLTGSCEIKESPETSAVLAVLDATNRWIARSE